MRAVILWQPMLASPGSWKVTPALTTSPRSPTSFRTSPVYMNSTAASTVSTENSLISSLLPGLLMLVARSLSKKGDLAARMALWQGGAPPGHFTRMSECLGVTA